MALPPAATDPPLAHAAPEAVPADRAALGSALALSATLAVGAFAAALGLALVLLHPDPGSLSARLGAQQHQGAKTALYLLGFAVLTPAAGLAGVRSADRIARGPNARALGPLVAIVAAALAAVLVLVRGSTLLPWGDGLAVVLVGVVVWAAGAAAALARAARGRPWPLLLALAERRVAVGVGAGVAVFAAVLCFTHLSAGAAAAVVAGSVAIVAAVARLGDRRLPILRRPWGPAVDVAALVLIVLAIPDLVVFEASAALPNVFTEPGIIQFHHDFLLGPTNQVLGGGTLLVDSPVSQYGVGSVYFLAAVFQLAPIGYGTYGLLDGVLTGLLFAAGYAVLRLAGASRAVAVPALALGVVALVLALDYPVGALPQQGPLRFGLPLALILATVAELRRPRWAPAGATAGLVVLGVSSVWALEAFAFTAMTLTALLGARAWLRPPGHRRSWLLRRIVLAAAACAAAHVLLAGATLAATGSLPDWGQYLAYLRAFLGGGEAGELTYGFEPWSPGLPLAVGYAVSAVALVLVGVRRPALAAHHATPWVTLAGLTAYGIALLSYTQNRSSTYLLPYVALPALLAAVLWTSVLLRSREPTVRRGGLAFALGLGLVVLASALPVGERFSRTALAHARPGGGLPDALSRLWDPPPIDPRAPEGERLLDRHLPGQERVLILLPRSPQLAVEILLRSGRSNALPVGNPVEESFVPTTWAPPLRRAIARLEPGTRILVNRDTFATLTALRARPGFDPLADPQIGGNALEDWILLELDRRFDLRLLAGGRAGFVVAELAR